MTTSPNSAIADIYAEAVLSADLAAGDVSRAVLTSLRFQELSQQVSQSAELRSNLTDASLPMAVRLGLVESLFSDQPPSFLSVLKMLVERQELKLLATVANRLTSLIEGHFTVTVIDVTTVVSLDDGLRRSIQEKYSAQLMAEVVLREHIDPGIMGGIVMEMHGRRIDASLNAQLVKARAVLASDTIGGVN